MPRQARKKSGRGIYHVLLRGINRQAFFEDQEDSDKLLKILGIYKAELNCSIYAYCFMHNHVHLLIRNAEAIIEAVSRCSNAAEFQALTREKRDWYLVQLKEKGLSVRQIERLTGINRGLCKRHKWVAKPPSLRHEIDK